MDCSVFRISKNAQIKFILADEIKNLCYCSDTKIIYYDQTTSLELYNYCVGEILEIFKIKLEKALTNKLKLHESIQMDVGFLLNEFVQKRQALPLLESGMGTDWVGVVNLIWSTDKLATWLYSKDNKIFLEITPVYAWHLLEQKKTEQFYSYEEFIKNYKPIVIFEISKDLAQQWLMKIDEMLNFIQQNEQK